MNYVQHLFSIKGRLSRKTYFAYCVLLLVLALLIGAISESHIFSLGILVLYVCFILQTVKRLHDLNRSGWWALLVLVPIVNLLAGVWVVLKKGTAGKNNYSLT